jgi:hypothetical protein
MAKIDMAGKKIGKLTVIKETKERNKEGRICWTCQCECGNAVDVDGKSLRNGNTKSCGCLQKERTSQSNKTHGLRHTRLYNIYADMKRRCENPNRSAYPRYGGRGIKVCDEWMKDFQAFYDWAMSNGYKEGLQIDRIDNDGDYSPENCRWVTAKENNNNRRDNVKIEIDGEEHTIAEWERLYGFKRYRLNRAIDRGVDIKQYLGQFQRRNENV